MPRHPMTPGLVSVALMALLSVGAQAQWLKSPTPGIPRGPDGKPDLTAPTPRTAEGKPDLSGVWQIRLPHGYVANIVADLSAEEIMPWAAEIARERISNFGKDDPWTIGCLPAGPRAKPEHLIAMKVQAIKDAPERTWQDLVDIAYLFRLDGVSRDEVRQYFESAGLLDKWYELTQSR